MLLFSTFALLSLLALAAAQDYYKVHSSSTLLSYAPSNTLSPDPQPRQIRRRTRPKESLPPPFEEVPPR